MDHPETCVSPVSNDTTILIDPISCSIGVASFLLVLPFVLFHVKQFPIGATGAVLLGSTITVLSQTISQHEVYDVIGKPENIRTICLLLGMMILAQYFDRELLADKLLSKILNTRGSFGWYLLIVTVFDFLLAAVFTNDVACVTLTPLILTQWKKRKNDKCKCELTVLLMGIATTANIGSAATIFGNPQMALIASKTSQPLFTGSRLDMRRCIFYLWLPAVLCCSVNYAFLLLYHYALKRIYYGRKVHINEKSSDQNQNRSMETGSVQDTTVSLEIGPVLDGDKVVPVNRSNSALDCDRADDWTASNSPIFHCILCLSVLVIMVLFVISGQKVHFDTGLVPMGVAIVVMASDAILNGRSGAAVLGRVDWSVLLMFLGMFVWLDGLNRTNAPRYIWNGLKVDEIMKGNKTALSYLLFYAFVLICSNIFSNVPLTIIVLELLSPCTDQLELVLYLAWISTIAGNLTLFGSVANLIVAQKAHSTIRYRLGFFEYLRYGLVTTLVLSAIGVSIIFALLQVY